MWKISQNFLSLLMIWLDSKMVTSLWDRNSYPLALMVDPHRRSPEDFKTTQRGPLFVESGKTKPRADLQKSAQNKTVDPVSCRYLDSEDQRKTSPGNFIWSCQCLDVGQRPLDMSSKCRVFFSRETKNQGSFCWFFWDCFTDVECFFLFRLSGGVGRKPKEFNRSFFILGIRVHPPPGMQSEPRKKKFRSATDRDWASWDVWNITQR